MGYVTFMYTALLSVAIAALVLPVSLASQIAGAVVGWAVMGVAFWLSLRYVRLTVLERTRGAWGATGILGLVDMYTMTALAISLFWMSLWLVDGSATKDGHISIPAAPTSSLYFVFLVLTFEGSSLFATVGMTQLVPVSTVAYLWAIMVVAIGVAWWGIVINWALHMLTERFHDRMMVAHKKEHTLPMYGQPSPSDGPRQQEPPGARIQQQQLHYQYPPPGPQGQMAFSPAQRTSSAQVESWRMGYPPPAAATKGGPGEGWVNGRGLAFPGSSRPRDGAANGLMVPPRHPGTGGALAVSGPPHKMGAENLV